VEIQLIDKRPALTVVLSLAKQEGDPRLPQWEEEMTRMVAEVSRKFYGSLTTETVRKGLNTTVGILSLGLHHSTAGGVDPEAWLVQLRTAGIKAISKSAIDLVKECAALPDSDFIAGSGGYGPTARDLLLICAKEGYPSLVAKIADRRMNQRAVKLAQWLLENSTVGRIARRNPKETIGDNALAEDVFFFVLARECAISADRLPEDDGRVIYLPVKIRKEAKKRYDDFVERIPEELRAALLFEGKNWFDRSVRPGSKPKEKIEDFEPEESTDVFE